MPARDEGLKVYIRLCLLKALASGLGLGVLLMKESLHRSATQELQKLGESKRHKSAGLKIQ